MTFSHPRAIIPLRQVSAMPLPGEVTDPVHDAHNTRAPSCRLLMFHEGLPGSYAQGRGVDTRALLLCLGLKGRVMADANERKRWVYTELDEDTHRTLYRASTAKGQHPSDVIEQYIVQGLTQDAEADETSLDLRVFAAVQETRRRDRLLAQLKQVAWACVQGTEDEQTYDLLSALCEEAGVTVDTMIEEVRGYKEAPLTSYDDGRGLVSAMGWLQKMLREREYPTTVILNIGQQQGFSKNILNDAKRRIGAKSVKKGKNWAWKLEVAD